MHAKTIKSYQKLSTARLKIKAQIAFNSWIRSRDQVDGIFTCIACGKIGTDGFQAGHFFSAGHYNALRFDELNCWACCVKCNYYLSGNLVPYERNLLAKIGEKALEKLKVKAGMSKRVLKKWDRIELIEIIIRYEKK